jgi:hypothetical protein
MENQPMSDNFNDTLEKIKGMQTKIDYWQRECHENADHLKHEAVLMNAVLQTEVMLVIADSLTRIADAMEAADCHNSSDDDEISIAEAVRIAHAAKNYSR